MDREGVDGAVCFRTYAAHALAFDDLDAPLAAGVCRAFNRWLAAAVAEAIHAVEALGAVTLVLPSHDRNAVVSLPRQPRARPRDGASAGAHAQPRRRPHGRCGGTSPFASLRVPRGQLRFVEVLGADNLVLSTDWPHDDSSYPHALEEFLDLPLSDDARRRILWDSCARLYGV